MGHPKRAITRDIRTRRPKRATRGAEDEAAVGWPEETVRVADVMTRPVTTFRAEMTVGAAIEAMRARKIRHAPVLDAKGALVGIVSDGDLREAILDPAVLDGLEDLRKALRVRTLKEVATWGPITVKPSTAIRQAALLMRENRIGALPVVEQGRIVGMVTGADILGTLIRLIDEGVISKPGRWGGED
ncbi:MAG TPA: CBS domain-containing protein [Candidatus Methylomirabilis sp.]|nr:CBS domain-containing protein [Candidatus Methylomirabilis sp.]